MSTYLLGIFFFCMLCSSQAVAQDTAWWEQQNPWPQSSNLYDVAMLDSNRFIAVGERGVILKTTDDGAQWDIKMLPTNGMPLSCIAFSVDKQHGIVLSTGGTIFATTDQGASWEKTERIITTDLKDACYRTALDVFVVGKFGTIIRSTDGGSTWVPAAFEWPDHLASIHFSDDQHGFIAAAYGVYYVTTNGGEHWIRRQAPFGNSLFAIHGTETAHTIAAGEAGGIFLSNDTAATWERQNVPTNSRINGVFRLDKDRAVVCGTKFALYGTTDGGKTWEARQPLIRQVNLMALSFAGSHGVCVGGDGIIFRTSDRGDTWYRIYGNVAELEILRGVYCLDTMTSVAVGSVILRTTNRGKKWARVPGEPHHTLRGVDFPTPAVGYAVGDYGTVMKTTDEGLTWKKLRTPFSSSLLAVSFLNQDTGIAVGSDDNGVIVHTSDGGISWKVSKAPIIMKLMGVSYLSPTTILIAGFENNNSLGIEQGICLRSTDASWSWKIITTLIPASAQCLSFTDSLHGYIGGVGISATTDGGLSWKPSTNVLQQVRAISAADELRATAVMDFGGSCHTIDGGKTWKYIPTNASGALYAVHHPSSTTATAVGYRAMILRMTTTDLPLDAVVHPVAFAAPGMVTAIYPNPARDRMTVRLGPLHRTDITLKLYSIDGKFVRELYTGYTTDLIEELIETDLSGLRSGSYVLAVSTLHRTEYHSIVILQ